LPQASDVSRPTVYRGSFSPMHINHTRFARQAVLEGFRPLVITFSHIPNPEKKLPSRTLRFQLAQMMLKLLPEEIQQHIHLLELKDGMSYDEYIEAIREVLKFPQGLLNFVAGTDTLDRTLDKSRSTLAIPNNHFNPVFYERLNTPVNRKRVLTLSKEQGMIVQIRPSGETQAMSSTKIRKWMRELNLEELRKLYPPDILDFLITHLKEFTQF
jgi:nicotinic acid mononucleotide adenylyltransferase